MVRLWGRGMRGDLFEAVSFVLVWGFGWGKGGLDSIVRFIVVFNCGRVPMGALQGFEDM